MKKTKVLLSLACAVMLVVTSVMGTMAYLTSTASVNNTFTVGNVKLGNDNEAGLDEAKTNAAGKPVNADGTEVALAEAPRVTSNTYKLQPGHTYTKDPTVHVGDSSDDCYLFVKVENGIYAIEDDTNTIAAQIKENSWKELGTGYDNIYVYVDNTTAPAVVSAGADKVVFEEFKVDDDVTDVSGYANANIKVTAYAVQKDGFEGKTATQIWNATFGAPTT